MKLIVHEKSSKLNLEDLELPYGIVVYERTSSVTSSKFAILAKLSPTRWGFVDMEGNSTGPCYESSYFKNCIESAIAAGRKCMQFKDYRDFVNWTKQ